ncbi:MAG: HI1506-related protein [Desulfobacterales bacterium]|nr:HI1506-related protein [Desulfobacterales bacterium]
MAVTIKSTKNRPFRRCGVRFVPEGETFADNKFTKAQLEILKAEPRLVVTEEKAAKSGGKKE